MSLLVKCPAAQVFPGAHREPIGDFRIKIFALHQIQRLFVPEIMAAAIDNVLDHIVGQGLIVDLDTAQYSLNVSDHIVIDDHAFERLADQAADDAGYAATRFPPASAAAMVVIAFS